MIFGRSILRWIVLAFLAVCVFVVAAWLIPLLFGAVGFPIPPQIVTILALLLALSVVWGGYGWRATPPA